MASRGLTEVKGRGLLETFDVAVDLARERAHLDARGGAWRGRRPSDGSVSDVPVMAMGAMDVDSLSPETRGRWAEAAAAGGGRWARFRDPALEAEFGRAAAGARRRGLALGLGLYWLTVAVQWLQVRVAPPSPPTPPLPSPAHHPTPPHPAPPSLSCRQGVTGNEPRSETLGRLLRRWTGRE